MHRIARTAFQATHASSNRPRTAAGSAMRAGFPARASSSLSGTLTPEVSRNATAYTANAARSQPRGPGERRCCQAAAAVRNSAPKKPAKNTGFSKTSLMFCMTSMKVRSPLRPSAGVTAQEKA